MAGGPGWIDADQHRIAIAVEPHGLDRLGVAAGRALDPQLFAAAAEEGGLAGGERLLERLAVHPGEHEHLAARCVLHDGGREPLLIEFEIHTGHRMGNPRAAHCSFTSPIESEPK